MSPDFAETGLSAVDPRSSLPTQSLTRSLKAELWQRYGTREHPAEWDGFVYGGGKLSQRFWEYFKTIELLDLTADSVVLDIGGGSPATGIGFFSGILARHVEKVVILDPNVSIPETRVGNVHFAKKNADRSALREVFEQHPDITHVSCVSVFEHIPPGVREEITAVINDHFEGVSFVLTLEYHSRKMFFKHQLTASTLGALVAPLKDFYPDAYEASPILCENAFDEDTILKRRSHRKLKWFKRVLRVERVLTPRWYPVAIRFRRADLPRSE
jgi:hypothetical protein